MNSSENSEKSNPQGHSMNFNLYLSYITLTGSTISQSPIFVRLFLSPVSLKVILIEDLSDFLGQKVIDNEFHSPLYHGLHEADISFAKSFLRNHNTNFVPKSMRQLPLRLWTRGPRFSDKSAEAFWAWMPSASNL